MLGGIPVHTEYQYLFSTQSWHCFRADPFHCCTAKRHTWMKRFWAKAKMGSLKEGLEMITKTLCQREAWFLPIGGFLVSVRRGPDICSPEMLLPSCLSDQLTIFFFSKVPCCCSCCCYVAVITKACLFVSFRCCCFLLQIKPEAFLE